MDDQIKTRLEFAKQTSRDAGELGMKYFASISDLVVERKGVQDLVSDADRDVEIFVRQQIINAYPDDGIVGEEYENVMGISGYTWVIDPIDGTSNFLSAIPAWCVIIACVHHDETKVAAIYDPCHDELFSAALNDGAFLNDNAVSVFAATSLRDGNLGIGMKGSSNPKKISTLINEIVINDGVFFRNASGGLMLAYVAAGRLIGYVEEHMNPWDCLAGQLLISEAGGVVEKQSADDMLKNGGRVIASSSGIFDELMSFALNAEFPGRMRPNI